jgi:hypothetical protein
MPKNVVIKSAMGYLVSADPDANGGRGSEEWTSDSSKAKRFEFQEAFETWRRQSNLVPVRDDGKPNRPLTAYAVEFVRVD